MSEDIDLDLQDFLRRREPGRASEDGEGRDPHLERIRVSARTYGIGSDLFERVAFLRYVGTPDELGEKRDAALEALRLVEGLMWGPDSRLLPHFPGDDAVGNRITRPESDGPEILDSLSGLARYLDGARVEAERALDTLRAEGFDYRDGKLVVTDTGGRPRQVVKDVVAATWKRIRPEYREETGDDSFASKALLARVRSELTPVFPTDLLTDTRLKSAIQAREPWR